MAIIQTRGRGALLVIFVLIYRLFLGIFLRTVYGIVCFPVPMESNGSHFFIHLRVKTLLFCYFVHQPGFPLVAFPPSLAKTKLQPYSFAS